MLEVVDNFGAFLIQEEEEFRCDKCGLEASIFQDEGNFCLDCWQEITEPQI